MIDFKSRPIWRFTEDWVLTNSKKLSTNGDFINRRIRKKYPNHRNATNFQTIKEKLNETYTIEKSHTVLFIFCLLTNIYALWTNSIGTAIILFIGNIIFNYYPNLLQQYNRIRYMRVVNSYSWRAISYDKTVRVKNAPLLPIKTIAMTG
jgi:hypothetical protein